MKRVGTVCLATFALITAGAIAGPGPRASADIGDAGCRAVVEPASAGDIYPSSPPRTDTGFRLRCNFEIDRFSFRTSKRLERVYQRPRLEGATADDSLRCGSLSDAVGSCSGEVGSGARVLGAIRVRGSACDAERLRTQFRVTGGEDCDGGDGCPSIGYEAVVRVEEPRGC